MSFDEQIETLKKLKDLLDAGVLTQEEFDAKKKEIMGLYGCKIQFYFYFKQIQIGATAYGKTHP